MARDMRAPLVLWRCFPWDPDVPEGAPFSPSYLPPGQTVGRFDLHDAPPIRYLAESPTHAVGEALAEFRGTRFRGAQLRKLGRTLALVDVRIEPPLQDRIADCTDPAVLARLALRPDQLAHHDRQITQAIARQLYTRKLAGLRWWSALTGAWHTTVLFTDRIVAGEMAFGTPQHLNPTHPAVQAALPVLGIRQ